jgi:hypothetical protein
MLYGLMSGAILGIAWVERAPAQEELYASPSVDFYINRNRGQDVPNVGLRATVQRDLNQGRPIGGSTYQPTFLQGGGASVGPSLPAQKPFANATHRPTVSPYLNLMREDFSDETVPNYHTLVRPQLEQIQFQQAQQQRNDVVYRQLQQIQARGGLSPQGSEEMIPTGHATGFLNYSYYYPFPGRRR